MTSVALFAEQPIIALALSSFIQHDNERSAPPRLSVVATLPLAYDGPISELPVADVAVVAVADITVSSYQYLMKILNLGRYDHSVVIVADPVSLVGQFPEPDAIISYEQVQQAMLPKVIRAAVQGMKCMPALPDADHPSVLLSRRDYIAFLGLCGGLRTKELARQLNLSPKTVVATRSQILARLGVASLRDWANYLDRWHLR